MEQKRQEVMEQLRRMIDGAQKNVDEGVNLYGMHADCAVEFAKNALELLESGERQAKPLDKTFRIEYKNKDNSVEVFETDSAAIVMATKVGSRNLCAVNGDTITALCLYSGMQAICQEMAGEDSALLECYEKIKDNLETGKREIERFPGHGELIDVSKE